MALTEEAKAKISAAMKARHAQAKATGKPWKNKKAGPASNTLVRQIEQEIEERQLLLKLLKGRGL